ncbi:hypothetical protein K502DRAFT_347180 [Neoconidiobolus thromboides FSU 785]|nr:hypothetical protein K502DRAFT_347180 [Neoconidiobolus thromboides FSU 785]
MALNDNRYTNDISKLEEYKEEYITPAFEDDQTKSKPASSQPISKKGNTLINFEQALEFTSHLKVIAFNDAQVTISDFGDHSDVLQNANDLR